MTEAVKLRWFYFLSACFIALNTVFIYHEQYWLYLTPVVLAIIGLAFLSLDKLLLLSVIVTPLSVDLKEVDIGAALSLPAEPLMIGTMVMFLFKALAEGTFDKNVLKHPVSLAIYAYLFWIFITSVTSEIPIVSFKFLASKLWFIIPFYFLGTQVFRKYQNIHWFLWLYILSLGGVIIYTTARHAAWGFEQQPSHWVMTPFYYDHTIYGAAIAMYFPFLVGYTFINRYGLFIKIFITAITGLFGIGLLLSYSRASWLSVMGALALFIVLFFRIRWYFIALLLVGGLIFYFTFQTEILMRLEKNKQDSSGKLAEHVQSMSNISTDASNKERLLRWSCAFRMFKERPITGWGPGTYAFVYAPFQRSYEMTIISTNFGDVGNAHSEYLGPLSEQGLPGLILFLLVIGMTYFTASRIIFHQQASRNIKQMGMLLLLGLCTYWIHGFLNNFLDTDKLSVPYWGFTAALVALDIQIKRNSQKTTS